MFITSTHETITVMARYVAFRSRYDSSEIDTAASGMLTNIINASRYSLIIAT